MNQKRRRSNLIGFLILSFFIVVIALKSARQFVQVAKDLRATKVILSGAANAFAEDDRDIILSWARGNVKDSWGNPIILKDSTDRITYQFLSKGPDGELGTKDDVEGKKHIRPQKIFEVIQVESESTVKDNVFAQFKNKFSDLFSKEAE